MPPPAMTEEQKAHLRALNARAEAIFAELMPLLDAHFSPAALRFAHDDLESGEFVLVLEDIAGVSAEENRLPPPAARPLLRELAGMMALDPESPARRMLLSLDRADAARGVA